MAQGDTGNGVHSGASDARLTELLRADTPTAYPALQELRERHRPAVLAYARLCTTSESTARQLAAQAFTLAARETARGTDPSVPWRHRLLLLAGQVAASWARDERAAGVEAGLLLVLNTAAPVPSMLPAFQTLPSRTQGLIWYAVVEREPDERTAALLGLTRADVTYGTAPALQQLAQACLRSRLAASEDPRCADFRRLIEEAVRPDSPRDSADLHAHMAHCPHCTAAFEELSALRDSPRTALAEGLLPWAGTAYVLSDTSEPRSNSRTATGTWPQSRRFALASAVLGVALVPLLVYLLSPDGSSSVGAAGSVTTPPGAPPVTVTATVPVSPSPSPSATSKSPSRSPSPSASPSSKPPKSPSPSPTYEPPGGTYAQVVNSASGLCLDIRDGEMEQGKDVITAPCGESSTQRWRVDAGRGVVQSSADPDYCLDSRGATDKGVGIWECASVDGSNGQNLKFAVGGDGVIRPAIAVETAVTPVGGGGVGLVAVSGGAEQRWRAGAR
ncbi:ricin-type beta-trefoil lectin domain protein [Streptomyces sp. 4N124]|uniref:ricin-type beta-trefoil lectin domain protein n=1 Tax=Streptomyces sp. 4N124 TaxID=3457420 RepID=UPI003FD57530